MGFKIPGKGQNLFELEGVAAWCECPAILTWIPRGSTGWSQVKLGFRDRLSTCGSTYCKCMWHPMGPVPALTWGEATQRLGSCWTARGDEGRPGRNSVCAWERDFWQHVWAFSGSFFFSILPDAAWAHCSLAAYQRAPRANSGLRKTGVGEARKKQADKAGLRTESAGRSVQVCGWKDSALGRTRKRLLSFTLQKEWDNSMKGKNCEDGKKAKESGRHNVLYLVLGRKIKGR